MIHSSHTKVAPGFPISFFFKPLPQKILQKSSQRIAPQIILKIVQGNPPAGTAETDRRLNFCPTLEQLHRWSKSLVWSNFLDHVKKWSLSGVANDVPILCYTSFLVYIFFGTG